MRDRQLRKILWLFFAFLIGLLASACTGDMSTELSTPGAPQPRLLELLLREDSFPPGWAESPEGPAPPSGQAPIGGGPAPIETLTLHFLIPADGGSGGAYEEVSRYWTPTDAANAYIKTVSKYFLNRYSWNVPPSIADWSPSATTWRLGCTSDEIPRCHFVAQYREYLVAFNIHTSAYSSDLRLVEIATPEQVLALVQQIDVDMSSAVQER